MMVGESETSGIKVKFVVMGGRCVGAASRGEVFCSLKKITNYNKYLVNLLVGVTLGTKRQA